jgi:gamma-glutamyltranspeptidase/glutathione hydrolase
MVSHVVDFRLNPQAAIEAPRVNVFRDFRVMIEARMPEATLRQLEERGHDCVIAGEWAFAEGQLGRGQMIVREHGGLLFAASDPRGDGVAQAV